MKLLQIFHAPTSGMLASALQFSSKLFAVRTFRRKVRS
jgi:hypothetical protein